MKILIIVDCVYFYSQYESNSDNVLAFLLGDAVNKDSKSVDSKVL